MSAIDPKSPISQEFPLSLPSLESEVKTPSEKTAGQWKWYRNENRAENRSPSNLPVGQSSPRTQLFEERLSLIEERDKALQDNNYLKQQAIGNEESLNRLRAELEETKLKLAASSIFIEVMRQKDKKTSFA